MITLASTVESPASPNSVPTVSPPAPLIDLLTGTRSASALAPDEVRDVVQASAFHGVDGLIWQQLRDQKTSNAPGLAELGRRARLQSQWELSHAAAVADLLNRCADAQIPVLLLKGTALAYSIYAAPSLRSRGDTDLLIAPKDRQRTQVLLAQVGFKSVGSTSSTDLQAGFERVDPSGARQVIDLHWAACNSPLLTGVWSFEELHTRAQRLPKLSPSALALSKSDALIHACLHWAINRHVPYHYGELSRVGGNRLIWLYDLHLLAQSLDANDLADLRQQLVAKRIASLCLPALRAALAHLPTPALSELVEQIKPLSRHNWRSWALSGGWLRRSLGELIASPHRARYLRDLLVADPEALRARYPNDSRSTPRLQLQRWLDGIRRRSGR